MMYLRRLSTLEAQKLQKRAATVGFDFSSANEVSACLLGEYKLEHAMASGDQNEIENELETYYSPSSMPQDT